MSCEYGYHCKQCDVSSETWINHGKEILSAYAHFWPVIQQMHSVSSGYLEVNINGYDWIMCQVWEFMEEHYKHAIELIDEYGKCEPLKQYAEGQTEPLVHVQQQISQDIKVGQD